MLFNLHLSVFQPVIHEPLSKPDHLLHQNGINGDVVENGGTSQEAPARTTESQGINTKDENKIWVTETLQTTYDINKTNKGTSNRPTYFTNYRWIKTYENWPMIADKLYTSL